MRNILLSTTAACLTAFTTATFANNSDFHVIGWQIFDTVTPGANDSGINDDSPDTNSTFDATPIGSHADNLYLSGKVGQNASTLGYKGLGNKAGLTTLNDSDYGPSASGANIVDYPQSTNKAGEISSTKSSWKFDVSNSKGDFTIINNSIYVFRVRDILFDALSASDFSGKVLEINYVGGGDNEELINANTNSEVEDGKLLFRYDFANLDNNALTSPAPTTVSADPAFTDNKFIPFATNQVAGSETAQTFEFVVEGAVPAGATYQIK
ncbi:MAG: hypothetical protein VX964_04405, partial [Verrucomicrobiota bacterium]|nr:hypothetical protein [Verrucomicrobiota bacterium]